MANNFDPYYAEILQDGRVLKLCFRADTPPNHGGPDWMPGFLAGARVRLNRANGPNTRLELLGCQAARGWLPSLNPYTAVTGANPLPRLPIFSSYVLRNTTTGEQKPAITEHYPIQGYYYTTSYIHDYVKTFYFAEPVPVGWVADAYLSTDGTPNTLSLYKEGLPPGTTSFTADSGTWANPLQLLPAPYVYWWAYFLVKDPRHVVTYGEAGITLEGDPDILQDDLGNSTASFRNLSVFNRAVVDPDGFTTDAWPNNPARTWYVAANGNDANPGTDISAPKLTFRAALIAAGKDETSYNTLGCRIKLRRGDSFEIVRNATLLRGGGASLNDPAIIESYWNPADGPDPGTRPIITNGYYEFKNYDRQYFVFRGLAFHDSITLLGRGVDRIFDDCVFWPNLDSKISVQMTSAQGQHVRSCFIRCLFRGPAEQGLLTHRDVDLLVSQCAFRDHGRFTTPNDMSKTHSVYTTGSSPQFVYWGNSFHRSAGATIQNRSGGVIAYCYADQPGFSLFHAGNGGSIFRNVITRARGNSNISGFGFGILTSSNYGPMLTYQIEQNLILEGEDVPTGIRIAPNYQVDGIRGPAPGYAEVWPPGGWGIDRLFVRNNTLVQAFKGDGAALYFYLYDPNINPYRNIVIANNLFDGTGRICTFPINMTSWAFWTANNNVMSTPAPNPYNVAGVGRNLATWQQMTRSDANAITTTPIYNRPGTTVADFYASRGGTNSRDAFHDALITRPWNTWRACDDMVSLWHFMAQAYKPTNLNGFGPDRFDYHGAIDTRPTKSLNVRAGSNHLRLEVR